MSVLPIGYPFRFGCLGSFRLLRSHSSALDVTTPIAWASEKYPDNHRDYQYYCTQQS